MGYETKMYVVETHSGVAVSKFCKRPSDGEYTNVFKQLDGSYIGYEQCGNEPILFDDYEIERKYSSLIGVVDLCKTGYGSALYSLQRNSPEAEHYLYCDDGNTPIITDRYDDFTTEADIEDVIAALEVDLEESDYRRFKMALAFLKACKKEFNDVKVLFYGY